MFNINMGMIKNMNVMQITNADLCLSCGFCESICPENCITIKFNPAKGFHEPIVNEKRCTNCQSCIDVCPGRAVDFPALNNIYGNPIPEFHNIGNIQRSCIGYSNDLQVRKDAASGGFITQFLHYLFDYNKIDGAILTKPNKKDAFNPCGYIARSFNEVLASQMSIYNSVSIGTVLKEINNDNQRYAFIGIPCQVHGLLNYIQQHPEIKINIRIIIGTFCGGYQTHFAHQYYFPKVGVPFDQIKNIDYRYGEFPGSFRLGLRNGQTKILPRRFPDKKQANRINTAFNSMFYIPRCYLCADKGNILADISTGDPWIPDCKGEKIGKSIILIRSDRGNTLFQQAIDKDYISIENIPFKTVMNAQKFNHERHGNQPAYQKLFKLFRKKYPDYTFLGKTQIINKRVYIRILIDCIKPFLQRKRWTWWLLRPLYFIEKHIRNIFIYNNPYTYFFKD